MKVIYHFARGTGFFLGEGLADPNPKDESAPLIPGFATDLPPPEPGEGEVAAFDMEAGAWILVPKPMAGETLLPPDLTIDQRIELLKRGVQAHLDAQSVAMGYDSISTAVTYADEPAVPQFQNEGRALRAWRSLVWAKCYELLGEFVAGEVEVPTVEQVIEKLPEFTP